MNHARNKPRPLTALFEQFLCHYLHIDAQRVAERKGQSSTLQDQDTSAHKVPDNPYTAQTRKNLRHSRNGSQSERTGLDPWGPRCQLSTHTSRRDVQHPALLPAMLQRVRQPD